MEILSGMILLLQVVILIQIMLVGKQVLHRVGVLDNNVKSLTEQMENLRMLEREETETEEGRDFLDNERKKRIEERTQEKESQEALLNEVLSEVFS